MSRPRVLVFAYACEPDHGSEPGAGWLWARMIARTAEVWVMTRANNRSLIEATIERTPERDAMHFVYVDLPAWARFWKRGQRGVHLYYLLWQAAAVLRARALQREIRFDLVWHLTLSGVWMGSLAPFAGGPLIYGPVGGGVRRLWRLLPALGFQGAIYELVLGASHTLGRYANPLARLAWRRASLILVQNPETWSWLPARHREKAQVLPNVVLEQIPPVERELRDGPPTAMFAGRLVPLKGVALGMRALALTQNWRFLIVGEGRDKARLQRLAHALRVADRVDFLRWQPRDELMAIMRTADVLLFPSLHDEAGWVVAEAMACGLPVVCLDRGGPPVLVGDVGPVAPFGGSSEVVARLAAGLEAVSGASETAREFATRRATAELSMDTVSERVAKIVSDAAGAAEQRKRPVRLELLAGGDRRPPS